MNKDVKQRIYEATRGGLNVMLELYGDALKEEDVDLTAGKSRAFRIRREERTPSALLKRIGGVWYCTDFGGDGIARNCFDALMQQRSLNFAQAARQLATQYGVCDVLKPETNTPNITTRPPQAGETADLVLWKTKTQPEADDLKALGRFVTPEIMNKFNVKALESYTFYTVPQKTQRPTVITIASTPDYPIFLYDFGRFQKIVCPKAYDKKHRFRYIGDKPQNVIFGLQQLEQDLEAWQIEHAGEKLPTLYLCSGERDALNVAGMGYSVVWLNSETAAFGSREMHELMKMAERVVNIPDIDETGIKQAYRRALENWELYTLLLPDWLKNYRDQRGHACKDVTDWCDLADSAADFARITETARRCQFYDYRADRHARWEINTASLLWFLHCHGFRRVFDSVAGCDILARIQGNIVTEYRAQEIRDFVKTELRRVAVSVSIQKLFLDSKKTGAALMNDLAPVDINFHLATPNDRVFFFDNVTMRVSADAIEPCACTADTPYCWASAVSPHAFRRLEPAFTATIEDANNITVNHTQSPFFRVLINASRIYWREEYETRAAGKTPAENAAYIRDFKFAINGPRLNEAERYEQAENLRNKCFALGYLLHQYKFQHLAKAVWIMENRLTTDGESSGGSGKSLMVKMLKMLKLLNIVTLPGRDRTLTDNKHLLDRISKWTDILFVDDPVQHFNFDFFYTLITGDTSVNPKGEKSFEIDYRDSPIPVFASNFPPPRGKEKSTLRRMLFVIFSDYYHEQGVDDTYAETRSPYDDLGFELCGVGYTEEHCNADLNFLLDCVQFYLRCIRAGISVQAPMENAIRRMNIAEMGNSGFEEWADVYFAKDGGHTDWYISRTEAFNDFRAATDNRFWTPQKFRRALQAFCDNSDYILALNPPALCTQGNRILKWRTDAVVECFYVQTQKHLNMDTPPAPEAPF